MKYLRKYNEASVYIQNSPIKDEISDILLELKEDLGFHYLIQNYLESNDANKLNKHEGTEFVKVNIEREDIFNYEDIEEYIERLKSFMKMNGYNIWDYTCYLGHRPPTPKVERDLRRQYNRFGEGRYTESCYTFSIKFIKGDNSKSTYMWMLGQDKSIYGNFFRDVNEELKPETYKSAADKLLKIGHTKRPSELMKWHDILKQRELDARKKKTLEDGKEFGLYKCKLRFNKTIRNVNTGGGSTSSSSQRVSQEYIGDFYLKLSFDSYMFDENHQDWKTGGGSLWLPLNFGVIPVDEEGLKYCEDVVKPIVGLGSDGVTYWLGCIYICLTEGNELDDLELKPTGKAFIECYEGDFQLTNRSSAILFKKKLYDLFAGTITIGDSPSEPGGVKEKIIEDLCNEYGHSIQEFIDVMESIKKVSINTLYKD